MVKSGKGENHIAVLDRVFERCRANKMKMNPLKCAFGVSAGTFWGFVFHRNGIEVDPSKIKAILEMPPPITLKQLKSLMGKISYIRWFIPNLSKKVKPWSVIMKKGFEFVWSEECQKAFQAMKDELLSPPVLMAGKPYHQLFVRYDKFARGVASAGGPRW